MVVWDLMSYLVLGEVGNSLATSLAHNECNLVSLKAGGLLALPSAPLHSYMDIQLTVLARTPK